MFSASKLTEEQKADLHRWAAEGASIADLQKRLKESHGLSITYMDARFMVLDLKIEILEVKEEEAKPAEAEASPEDAGIPNAAGAVSISADAIALPGALVSGKVVFSDGASGVWMIDQYGRPALDPDEPGYRPSAEDIREFQTQLSALLRKQGY
ncbi:MAG: hypothetical protein MUF31_05805 [Akkermansiaceae bacterium]|nr:hypothetical protein [Akkermansiaceae bacterium]